MIPTAALLVLTCGPMAQVELRGSGEVYGDAVTAVALQGVTVRVGSVEEVLGWDRVRRVQGEWAVEAEPFAAMARDAWRARTRLERGDIQAAEPIFERLFEVHAGAAGPTARVVASGLFRCRIARQSRTLAIGPWLALLAALEPGGSGADGGEETLDARTGLAPALPPIWLGTPAVQAFARDEPAIGASGGERAALLAALYHASARVECGLEADLPPLDDADEGVSLVGAIVRSRGGAAEERADARLWLERRLNAEPSAWVEVWCRAALGRSLVREPDPETKRLGVVELLGVFVRHRGVNDVITCTALAEAAVTLHDLGDGRGAAAVYAELLALDPRSEALDWSPLRRVSPPRAAPDEIKTDEAARPPGP